MIDLALFKKIVKKNISYGKNLVFPLSKELTIDTETPISLFLKLTSNQKFAYLLESAETNLRWGRYSFISFSPYVIFSSKLNEIKIFNNKWSYFKGDPFEKIRQLLKEFYLPSDVFYKNDIPRFIGGFVGYIGYENIHIIEPKVEKPLKDDFQKIPDIYLTFNKFVLIIDHYLNKLQIVNLVLVDKNSDLEEMYFLAKEEIESIEKTIRTTISLPKDINFSYYNNFNFDIKEYDFNISKKEFINMVNNAKRYIYNGDIIQVVISRRIFKFTNADPFDIYRSLRMINPSAYMFYLKFDNVILIGSSPEILIRKELDTVETRPIAGTRPRGRTEEEDIFYEKELINSQKENAEHIMLVDLARNDIGRISKYKSISLPHFKIIEKFSHVMHIVSTVKGVVRDGLDSIDVLKACFPAGTVSGAPKVRAMQIISELEGETRGPYAGAVGYFSLTGDMDMAITIRTIVYLDRKVYIQTGAGIVADSVAYKEYQETLNKAKALILAVKIAEGR
ncbi:MAG: anthranilate synthase component I [Elusimicrobiota bacterium]|nr:anthranilate synthase component I [Endomicrobiia bacterium]MCX7910656.1 anthranilate synthase component I [Endomicrobiia bacterium]MDW8166213.1 anthranilate synthase component I [Elusimicrobiota bacterium]